MSQTFKGVTAPVGTKDRPGSEDQNRPAGHDQQSPLPNENQSNKPYSSAGFDPANQQHQWNDTPPEAGLSEGVTQGSHNVQGEKHGRSGEAQSKSSTGLPEQREHTGTPPSVENRQDHQG